MTQVKWIMMEIKGWEVWVVEWVAWIQMISSEHFLEAEDSQVVSEDKRVVVRFSQVWEEWVDLEAVEIILNSLTDLVDHVFIILNLNNLYKFIFFINLL